LIENEISDISMNLNATDNYLEKYIPFRIQNFISENLENALSKQQFKKFQVFEMKKYKQMHEVILKDEGEAALEKEFRIPKSPVLEDNLTLEYENAGAENFVRV
jgi:hypothetical protein